MILRGFSMRAAAKINLSLDVIRKREDGYHDLSMIMQSLKLHDIVTVRPASEGIIEVYSGTKYAPNGAGNTVYAAAQLIRQEFGIRHGIEISVLKRIPVAAGLAGGSADAAAALKLMNRLWKLGLSLRELQELGLRIGADVPFCLENGTCLAEGVGERLTKISQNVFSKNIGILICKPPVAVSTAQVFGAYNLNNTCETVEVCKSDEIIQINENNETTNSGLKRQMKDQFSAQKLSHPDNPALIKNIENGELKKLASGMVNVLENVTIKILPVIEDIKNEMISYGALGSMMSGSGPSVFGIFDDKENMKKAYINMKKKYKETFLTETSDSEWCDDIKNLRR